MKLFHNGSNDNKMMKESQREGKGERKKAVTYSFYNTIL